MPEETANVEAGATQNNSEAAGGSQQQTPDVQALIRQGIADAIAPLRNSLFAELRKSAKQQATTDDRQKATSDDAEATLADRMRALEEERARVEEDRRENAIRSALTSSGVPADRQEIALDHLERRYGKKVQYDKESRKVVYREFEGDNPQEIGAFIANFLKTSGGQMFLPAPAVGGLPGGHNRVGGKPPYASLPQEERLKMTLAQKAAYVAANG